MMKYIDEEMVKKRLKRRIRNNKRSKILFLLSTLFGFVFLAILIIRVVSEGIGWIDWNFLLGLQSNDPARAGIFGAIIGTLWLMLVVIPVTMFIGVGSAIYLELYAKHSKFRSFAAVNIANLAGVPSIVYGLLGLTLFVRAMDLGNVVLAGGLTLSLLVLPIVIVSAQEAIRAVPQQFSEASYGMGASRWQTIKMVILPACLPGILTGSILALSRAIGETAPLTVLGIPALLLPFPGSLFDTFTALPMQIYYWTLDASLVSAYAYLASATIIVLLVLLFLLNLAAIMIRHKYQQIY